MEEQTGSGSVEWERLLTEADFDMITAIQDGNQTQYEKAREIKEWLLHLQQTLKDQ